MVYIFLLLCSLIGYSFSEPVYPDFKDKNNTGAILSGYEPNPSVYSLSFMGIELSLLCAGGKYTPSYNTFKNGFKRPPEWEHDPFIFNYILHPLWGSETYLRARESEYGVAGSIAFSMGASIVWEYLVESWIKHPSTPDLIFTTGIGWGIGELRYYMKQMLSSGNRWWIDPLYSVLKSIRVAFKKEQHSQEAVTVITVVSEF